MADIAHDKRATDIVILELSSVSTIADYFIVCTATNKRQVQTIAQEIRTEMKKRKVPALSIEGLADSQWVLVDLGECVAHIFQKNAREYYNLEMMWTDATEVSWQSSPRKAKAQ